MSRGVNYNQARELLINGFLLDVVEKQKEDIFKLKNRIEQIETLLDIKVQDLLRAVK